MNIKSNYKNNNFSASDIMAMGGDARIILNEDNGLNTYGHAPFPKFTVAYSSCTSNTISDSAYSYVESYLNILQHKYKDGLSTAVFVQEFETIRKKIAAYYELGANVEMVFGSSGTDIELIQLALSLSHNKPVHNIILSANEVGSGIKNAACGRYFSDITPKGVSCNVGEIIPGFSNRLISYSNIEIRDENGIVRNSKDLYSAYCSEIEAAISSGKRVIVHAIHRSKTGLILPEFYEIERLVKKFRDHIDLVVDCCQGRISIKRVNDYLKLGASVLLTGSKFYSGPPFSGVLILPQDKKNQPLDVASFPGLNAFFSTPEYPLSWQADYADEKPYDNNPGLLLRWKATTYEMNKVFLVPNKRIKFVINAFTEATRNMIESSAFLMEISASSQTIEDKEPSNTESPFELNSIITFAVKKSVDEDLNLDDAKIIHKALYTNLEEIIGIDGKIPAMITQLGQPVKVMRNPDGNWAATLRLALSSNLIGELGLLDDDIVHMRFQSDMQMIHDKLCLILEHFDMIKKRLPND